MQQIGTSPDQSKSTRPTITETRIRVSFATSTLILVKEPTTVRTQRGAVCATWSWGILQKTGTPTPRSERESGWGCSISHQSCPLNNQHHPRRLNTDASHGVASSQIKLIKTSDPVNVQNQGAQILMNPFAR